MHIVTDTPLGRISITDTNPDTNPNPNLSPTNPNPTTIDVKF